MPEQAIPAAIQLIGQVPGYAAVAQELADLLARGRIRYVPELPDRGQATLNGTILLGPEPFTGSIVGLAETLVHENFHRHQFPLLKTASFWAGVATRTPIMQRYERPAYEAALQFLKALTVARPEYAAEVAAERAAIIAQFAAEYGAYLNE
jgi:hypothetical protein